MVVQNGITGFDHPGNGCPGFSCLLCLDEMWLGVLAPSVFGVESIRAEATLDLNASWLRSDLGDVEEAVLRAVLPSGETQVITTLRFSD